MSDKEWWEPKVNEDGSLNWFCDHEGDYEEKITRLWQEFTKLQARLAEAATTYKVVGEFDGNGAGEFYKDPTTGIKSRRQRGELLYVRESMNSPQGDK